MSKSQTQKFYGLLIKQVRDLLDEHPDMKMECAINLIVRANVLPLSDADELKSRIDNKPAFERYRNR